VQHLPLLLIFLSAIVHFAATSTHASDKDAGLVVDAERQEHRGQEQSWPGHGTSSHQR
jgi:hypothetical protein